jgi:hypothetical protein
VPVEIQDPQTAKEAFGSHAEADSVGDADATHAAGTTVLIAMKSMKKIFSKGPNFAAIEQSGQDQGRVILPLIFSERHLSPKRFSKLQTLP